MNCSSRFTSELLVHGLFQNLPAEFVYAERSGIVHDGLQIAFIEGTSLHVPPCCGHRLRLKLFKFAAKVRNLKTVRNINQHGPDTCAEKKHQQTEQTACFVDHFSYPQKLAARKLRFSKGSPAEEVLYQ